MVRDAERSLGIHLVRLEGASDLACRLTLWEVLPEAGNLPESPDSTP